MVKLENNCNAFVKDLKLVIDKTRFELSNQILNDCNYFVREDTGELRRSSVRGSDLQKGIIGWDTDYARKVYFTGIPSTDVNPNASLMWVETARSRFGDDWVEFLKRKLAKEVNNDTNT